MKHRKLFLDPKQCFDAWIESGSVYKAPQLLNLKYGITNPRTGKLVTQQGVWDSAWRYVLDNPAEAKKLIENVWRANGEILSDEVWYKMLINKAKYLFTPKRYKKFIEKNLYLTPYQ